uniref:Uncharacterized protein n=1 Tax=Aegilops tauschii subsp. strangulata TaxID=200361 RepID=A0A452XSE3_AEGTS
YAASYTGGVCCVHIGEIFSLTGYTSVRSDLEVCRM